MPRANGITRQEILTTIKRTGALTADDLSREMGISQVAVRQHLASLEAEGIVVVNVERKGLGRPSHRYQLTESGDETFPRQYDTLANALLEELRVWQGDDAVAELFCRLREREGMSLTPRMRGKTLKAKVMEIARSQTQNGYMAEAVDDGDGVFHIMEYNCSICSVARNNPDTCCDSKLNLFRTMLSPATVERDAFMMEGDHTCAFKVTTAAEN